MTTAELRNVARGLLEIDTLSEVMKAAADHASPGLLSAMRGHVRNGNSIAAASYEGQLKGLENAFLTLKAFAASKE